MDRKEKIRSFIVETFLFGASQTSFNDDESLLESGIIDSTGVLELVSFVEEEFGIDVRDEDLVPDNFDSLNRLSSYIERKEQVA